MNNDKEIITSIPIDNLSSSSDLTISPSNISTSQLEKEPENIISFPHLGSYYIPIKYIISKVTKCKILTPPLNNKNTITLGSKYSPNDICMPFKYNLGNYIYALEHGANILIQAGGGCRYGYFAELQEQILEDLGYNFTFVNLIKDNHVSIFKMYQFAKQINPKLNIFSYFYYLIQGFLIIIFMDKLNKYRRTHQALAINPEMFNIKHQKMLKTYSQNNLSIIKIFRIYHHFKKTYQQIPLTETNPNTIKILLIGELYSLMDSAASNNLEETLINEGIVVYRYTDLTYLLLTKRFRRRYILHKSRKYLKYTLGADGAESIYHALQHSQNGIDGIIHIKSYSCVPEINAMPILSKISEDYHVPILYLSFDGENNISNIDTKLEAFYDMIKSKKTKQ